MHRSFALGISLFGVLLAGCSQKQIDGDDLRCQVEHAQKLAHECVVFLDLKDQQHLTLPFSRSHADYLRKQSQELKEQIKDKQPKAEIASVFNEYRNELDRLSQEASRLDSSPDKQHLQELDRSLRNLEGEF